MHVFDASSIIYAWDNYPIENFPPMWDWMASQVQVGNFSISMVALQEVSHKLPDCGSWLKEQNVTVLPLTNRELQQALTIKHILGIVEDNYHADGVGENDLLIIATAKVNGAVLVSDEKQQFILPKNMARYKIPAVCNLAQVQIVCISFVELIKNSGAVFR